MLFEVFSQRHERSSTIVTSNLFNRWEIGGQPQPFRDNEWYRYRGQVGLLCPGGWLIASPRIACETGLKRALILSE